MTRVETGATVRTWLRWEWRAALVTVAGGFVVAIGILAYFTYRAAHAPRPMTTAQRLRVDTEASQALCTQALDRAKAFGIVPGFGKLAASGLERTTVKGRYACLATTGAAKYVVSADLICRDLRDKRCVALYSVTQDDGTVLYKRQAG